MLWHNILQNQQPKILIKRTFIHYVNTMTFYTMTNIHETIASKFQINRLNFTMLVLINEVIVVVNSNH